MACDSASVAALAQGCVTSNAKVLTPIPKSRLQSRMAVNHSKLLETSSGIPSIRRCNASPKTKAPNKNKDHARPGCRCSPQLVATTTRQWSKCLAKKINPSDGCGPGPPQLIGEL